MHVAVRKHDNAVIADLQGRLVGGIGDEILRGVVNELLAEGWRKILLNLTGVTALDSAGVGELVASLRTTHHLGAEMKVLNLNERVRRTLHMAALLPVFDVYDDEAAALASFPAGGPAAPQTARGTPGTGAKTHRGGHS